jgi:hypothetical protein
VQVDPFKPTLKAPETKRSKVKYVELLSNFAFKINVRRQNQVSGYCDARDTVAVR